MTETEWLALSCRDCGHWKKGEFTKDDVADWLRAHGNAGVRDLDTETTCESTCPWPCEGVR